MKAYIDFNCIFISFLAFSQTAATAIPTTPKQLTDKQFN